ncbi:hypothetical protein Ga0074812_13421 [Parafrankia irregularis]|uniref:Uncharacterized protein n=1 Tax=Parafrankia irregularis TaxID=795642 RepID=A0A0S4QWQ8_9ACTN|nr:MULTISPECIES: Rv3235 family protein [Parafrankia]MBE3202844.1 hypothetical protein [Parafrankia sp. CH37]CUU59991.1 hypothetical protein Ga0074812_13421 [Parafrankia irregularis]
MTATTALTLPRRRRPHVVAVPGLLPVRSVDPPYDDEIAPGTGAAPGARHRSIDRPRPARATGGAVSTAPREVTSGAHRLAERGALRPLLPEQLTLPLSRQREQSPPRRAASAPATSGHPRQQQAPDPRRTAAVVVRLIVEVLSGARPMAHLTPWTTADLQHDLQRTAAALTNRQPSQVRSVRVSEPTPGIAEVSAVISRGQRMRALALRMERGADRWQVTTLQLG